MKLSSQKVRSVNIKDTLQLLHKIFSRPWLRVRLAGSNTRPPVLRQPQAAPSGQLASCMAAAVVSVCMRSCCKIWMDLLQLRHAHHAWIVFVELYWYLDQKMVLFLG